MQCPFCSAKTKVYNSRRSHQATQTWRRRQCLSCSKAFTTREKVDFNGITTVRDGNDLQPYSRERLLLSIIKASQALSLAPEMPAELTDSIELKLQKAHHFDIAELDSGTIAEITLEVLISFNANLALQYANNIHDHQPPRALIQRILATQ